MEKIDDAVQRLGDFFYDDRLSELYGTANVGTQRQRYINLLNWHKAFFNVEKAMILSSPGRTELGGNQTDHNGGIVLAAAVNVDSVAVVTKTDDTVVTVNSENFPLFKVDLTDLEKREDESGKTEALIRGVAASLARKGYRIGGFKASIVSDVLPGSGLSSSASIEILLGTIFNSLYNDNAVSITELALFGKEAENHYFGKHCGLMDPLACGTGGIIAMDFREGETPQITPIDLYFDDFEYELFIIHTGGSYSRLDEDFNSIPAEMKEAASVLGKNICRETTEVDLLAEMPAIREKFGDRTFLRAIHFFRENRRVKEMIDCLLHNDFETYLKLVSRSGNSSFKYLQNCYSAKDVKKQGIPVGLAICEGFLDGHGVCRVHGGGFAGTIQAYVPRDRAEDFQLFMGSIFGEDSVRMLKIREASAGPVLLT
ncbi:galactokinase [Spirochaeta isovalerica]|uniref:Galactokinase n=1 Tax=Spirochaeta isovalerica TaxID=150 RepID=A0A841RH87_9SPIO|nr:galactokinase family protein [Spirochaeta isovalerica]MBB6481888.1 galactokinase [Spirochaeta isovalerica]